MTQKTPSVEDYERACRFLQGKRESPTQLLIVYTKLFNSGGDISSREIANQLGGKTTAATVASRLNELALMGLAKVKGVEAGVRSSRGAQLWDICGDIPKRLERKEPEAWFLVLSLIGKESSGSASYPVSEFNLRDLQREFSPKFYRIVRVSASSVRRERK
jgi:hypothetical protein